MSIYKNGKLIAGGSQCMPLLSFMWADHILNDASWLRADTFSWQSGAVYQAVYQHLIDDWNASKETVWFVIIANSGYWYSNSSLDQPGKVHPYAFTNEYGENLAYADTAQPTVGEALYDGPGSGATLVGNLTSAYEDWVIWMYKETIAGTTISYMVAPDGHKLVHGNQESNVTAIYNATGVAWYYIIDRTNQRFKLPRTKHGKFGNIPVIGNGKTLGLTDGTRNLGLTVENNISAGMMPTAYNLPVGIPASGGIGGNLTVGVTTDKTKSGIIAQQEQDTDQYKYLYFYVGQFTQTALENTAGVTTEVLNDKVDKGHEVIAFQTPTSANNYTWYRKYADGWVEQGGIATIPSRTGQGVSGLFKTFPVAMADTNYTALISFQSGGTYFADCQLSFANRQTTGVNLEFYFAGSGTTAAFLVGWQVSGMAA